MARLIGINHIALEVELVEPRTPLMGWAQMIRRRPDGAYEAGADPRADSLASGP